MAFWVAIQIGVTVAAAGATVGAGVYTVKEGEKVAKETERLQGEWSYKNAWADVATSYGSGPGSIHT